MIQTVEAIVDEHGGIRLHQPVQVSGRHRALVIILDEEPAAALHETALLSESALAKDWNRPEESIAWLSIQPSSDPRIDAQVLARRRQLLREIDELRAEIKHYSGIHPDSTPMFREMRDNE